MNWVWKSRVHRLLSTIPWGHRLNRLVQRHITHSYPRSDPRFAAVVDRGKRHIRGVEGAGVDPSRSAFFEFGAGWDLAVPISFSSMGVRDQTVVDLRPLADPELVEATIERVAASHALLGLPAPVAARGHGAMERLTQLGIRYWGSCDARHTGLPDGSIDVVTSTSTLEHIPADDIPAVLAECWRMLRPGGLMSFIVDYGDHYSYTDPSISVFNFLRFDDAAWRRFNPSSHYQNRLRHSDYLRLYEEAGFELVQASTPDIDERHGAELRAVPRARRFDQYTEDDLLVTGSDVLLRKPQATGC